MKRCECECGIKITYVVFDVKLPFNSCRLNMIFYYNFWELFLHKNQIYEDYDFFLKIDIDLIVCVSCLAARISKKTKNRVQPFLFRVSKFPSFWFSSFDMSGKFFRRDGFRDYFEVSIFGFGRLRMQDSYEYRIKGFEDLDRLERTFTFSFLSTCWKNKLVLFQKSNISN